MLVRISMAALLIAAPATALFGQDAKPRFEVASVRPRAALDGPTQGIRAGGLLEMPNETLWSIVQYAYNLDSDAWVIGELPDWAYTESWSISAKATGRVPNDQLRLMTQSLLDERFGMSAQWEERELPHLELVRARTDGQLGPNIRALEREDQCADRDVRARILENSPPGSQGRLVGCGPFSGFVRILSGLTGQAVVDKTGVRIAVYGLFSIPNAMAGLNRRLPAAAKPRGDVDGLRHALNDQMGLRLEASRAPIRVLVVSGVNRPTPN